MQGQRVSTFDPLNCGYAHNYTVGNHGAGSVPYIPGEVPYRTSAAEQASDNVPHQYASYAASEGIARASHSPIPLSSSYVNPNSIPAMPTNFENDNIRMQSPITLTSAH